MRYYKRGFVISHVDWKECFLQWCVYILYVGAKRNYPQQSSNHLNKNLVWNLECAQLGCIWSVLNWGEKHLNCSNHSIN
jgi:hypothetical protein